MQKILSVLLITLTVGMSTLSARCDEAVYLPKGGVAGFSGYEITPDQATKVRNNQIDLSTQTKLNTNLTEENSLLNQRVSNAQVQNESLSKQLVEQKDTGVFAKIGMFVLGAGITGLVSYGIYKSR
jgi:hypothetical protein